MRVGCRSESGLSKAEFNHTLRRRFELKCGVSDARGCIPWLATKTSKGYGILQVAGAGSTKTVAHRIAWVLRHGDLAPEVLVLHRCDNPSCVNADHLFLGSAKHNTEDMVAKGRHSWRNGTPWQKLTAADGARIRELRNAGHTQQYVADLMGVSRPLISLIESGKVKHSMLSAISA
jgi:DNA-binding XRE family transcriptional regulator